MKIKEYKYKPAGNWFTKLFKKKKHRWSSERFNDVLKFIDKHIDYSKVMCASFTPDIFTMFNVLVRENGKNPPEYLMKREKDYIMFTPIPGKEIPAINDPYVALNSNNQEVCSYVMFKYDNGDIVFVTFEKLKLFSESADSFS